MDFDAINLHSLRRRRGAKWADVPADVIPAWVADMDLPVAEPVSKMMQAMIAGSDLGYPSGPNADDLPTVFADRMHHRFGWSIDPACVEVLTDVVQGLYLAISLFCEPGDAIVTPTPIYPPFLAAVKAHRCVPVWQRYVPTPEGYRIDFDRLRAELPPNTRMLLLCNPHNPTGRVLRREELTALAEIALERDLLVVSDEIHADLVYEGATHVPLASLGPEISARTITLTSASKAFNLAGLRCAVAVFGTQDLRRRLRRFDPHARGGLGILGLAATSCAWSECQTWLDEALAHLQKNRDTIAEHARLHWDGVVHHKPEATYLAWLDFRARALPMSPQSHFLEHGRVALSDGRDFGDGGEGFVRLNFATSRSILGEILQRMDHALEVAAA